MLSVPFLAMYFVKSKHAKPDPDSTHRRARHPEEVYCPFGTEYDNNKNWSRKCAPREQERKDQAF